MNSGYTSTTSSDSTPPLTPLAWHPLTPPTRPDSGDVMPSRTLAPGVTVALPSVADLILTKRFAARPRDLEDIRLLEILRREIE